jgi:hypothetical protein
MKKEAAALALVRDIAQALNQPEGLVLAAYNEATADLKRDARIHDFVPLFAAKRVRETLRMRDAEPQQVA